MPAKQITLCMQFYICSTWVNLGKGPNRELWSNSDDLSTVLQGSCDVSSNCHSWCKISRMDTQLVAKLVRLQKINNLSLYPFLSLHTEIGKFHQEYFAIKTAENNEKYQDNNFLFGINANKHVKSTSWTCSRILQNIRHHMADTGLSDSPHPIQQWDVWQSGSPWMTVNDLMICMVSHMHFIQEWHAGLVVVGTYRAPAKQLFDSMGGTTTSFAHPQIVQRVETAAKLA